MRRALQLLLRRPLVARLAASGSASPHNTVAPAVTGTETEGETLSVTDGTWTGAAPITYSYQWYQAVTEVQGVGPPLTDVNGNYVGIAISAATNATYVLQASDVGELIFCDVTASNGVGSPVVKSSNATGAIASPVWSPADLPGIVGWYEADNGVTQAAGRVSQWNDQSGGGNHVVQATGGNQPLYSATGFNTAFPGITFVPARTDNLAKSSFSFASSSFSIFVLGKFNASGTSNYSVLDIFGNGAAAYYETPSLLIEGGSTPDVNVDTYSSGAVSGGGVSWSGSPAAAMFGIIGNGTTATRYKDGTSTGSGAFSSTIGSNPNVLKFGGPTVFLDGTLAAVFIGTSAWDATAISNLVSYINGKWGTSF